MKTRLSFPKIIGQKFQENLSIIFYVRENIVRRENSHFLWFLRTVVRVIWI